MFDWDRNNLRKIKAHGITRIEVEQLVEASPILIYEQEADSEMRYVYYGETGLLRMLAVVLPDTSHARRVIDGQDDKTYRNPQVHLGNTRGEMVGKR